MSNFRKFLNRPHSVEIGQAELAPRPSVEIGQAQLYPRHSVEIGQAQLDPPSSVEIGQAEVYPSPSMRSVPVSDHVDGGELIDGSTLGADLSSAVEERLRALGLDSPSPQAMKLMALKKIMGGVR